MSTPGSGSGSGMLMRGNEAPQPGAGASIIRHHVCVVSLCLPPLMSPQVTLTADTRPAPGEVQMLGVNTSHRNPRSLLQQEAPPPHKCQVAADSAHSGKILVNHARLNIKTVSRIVYL